LIVQGEERSIVEHLQQRQEELAEAHMLRMNNWEEEVTKDS
jgi:predicted alpha/beta hydrolase family esterase